MQDALDDLFSILSPRQVFLLGQLSSWVEVNNTEKINELSTKFLEDGFQDELNCFLSIITGKHC